MAKPQGFCMLLPSVHIVSNGL